MKILDPDEIASGATKVVSHYGWLLATVGVVAVGGFVYYQVQQNAASNTSANTPGDTGYYSPYSGPITTQYDPNSAGGTITNGTLSGNSSVNTTPTTTTPATNTDLSSILAAIQGLANKGAPTSVDTVIPAGRLPLITSNTGSPVIPGDPTSTALLNYQATGQDQQFQLAQENIGLQTLQTNNAFKIAQLNASTQLASNWALLQQTAMTTSAAEAVASYADEASILANYLNHGYGGLSGGITNSSGQSFDINIGTVTGDSRVNNNLQADTKNGVLAFFNNAFNASLASSAPSQATPQFITGPAPAVYSGNTSGQLPTYLTQAAYTASTNSPIISGANVANITSGPGSAGSHAPAYVAPAPVYAPATAAVSQVKGGVILPPGKGASQA